MRRNLNAQLGGWLDRMMAEVRATLHKARVNGKETDNFSVLASVILGEILDLSGRQTGNYGGHAFHLLDNASRLGIGRKTLKKYLVAMARAGIIKAISARTAERQLPLEIIVNPEVKQAAGTTTILAARALGQYFGKIWLERGAFDFDAQGFSADRVTRWGRYVEIEIGNLGEGVMLPRGKELADEAPAEPSATTEHTTSVKDDDLIKAIKLQEQTLKSVEQRRAKLAEREEKQKKLDEFIAGCAGMWANYAAKRGFVDAGGPAWAAPKKDLSSVLLKERKELEKIVAMYGGETTAWAWTVYCSGVANRDQNGKLIFDPAIAHKQWTTPDKKPSHFTRHFQLILNEVNRLGWRNDAEVTAKVRSYFGPGYDLLAWVEIPKTQLPQAAREA